MKLIVPLVLLSALTLPALAQTAPWQEPDSSLAPPPVDQFLDELDRREEAETPPAQRADERQQRDIAPLREARQLGTDLGVLRDRFAAAIDGLAEAQPSDQPAIALRRAELEEWQRTALRDWSFAKIRSAELAYDLGPDDPFLARVDALLTELRTLQRQAQGLLDQNPEPSLRPIRTTK